MTDASKIREICMTVCAEFSVSNLDINSSRCDRRTAMARHWGMYIMRKQYAWSFPKIGRALGDRDHKTAWSAVAKIENLISKSPEYAQTYLRLMAKCDKLSALN